MDHKWKKKIQSACKGATRGLTASKKDELEDLKELSLQGITTHVNLYTTYGRSFLKGSFLPCNSSITWYMKENFTQDLKTTDA